MERLNVFQARGQKNNFGFGYMFEGNEQVFLFIEKTSNTSTFTSQIIVPEEQWDEFLEYTRQNLWVLGKKTPPIKVVAENPLKAGDRNYFFDIVPNKTKGGGNHLVIKESIKNKENMGYTAKKVCVFDDEAEMFSYGIQKFNELYYKERYEDNFDHENDYDVDEYADVPREILVNMVKNMEIEINNAHHFLDEMEVPGDSEGGCFCITCRMEHLLGMKDLNDEDDE